MERFYRSSSSAILKLISMLISAVLGIFWGCKNSPHVVEYGMPYADYKFSGTVQSVDQKLPIKGLLISLKDTTSSSFIIDSAKTDSLGKYSMEFSSSPWDNTWILTVKDIDSSENGLFLTKDTIVSIPSSDLRDASGSWYQGHAEKTVNLNVDRSN